MLDDEINFNKLNIFHSYDGWEGFINYILANQTGSVLKRPISTLSFLLNATNWPANAYYFKLTNIILHIINGFLLYVASLKIISIIGQSSSNLKLVALLSALLWVVHPFFVSTVLYANQRQAMLPATFTLIGIILYCRGRLIIGENRKKALLSLYAAIFIGTSFAVLSKENGILLPLLIFILESTVISRSGLVKLSKFHMWMLFYIPFIVIISSLAYKFPDYYHFYDSRYFTMGERMLTQSRVIMQYLHHLFVPEYFTEGLYTDGFSQSTGFFHPISTLISTIFLFTLIWISIFIRKSQPLFSFGILFYFAGHLLESTFIPLELYFEHRNYLPAMFIPLFISCFLIKIGQKNKISFFIPILIIGFLSFTTFKRASLWGDNAVLTTKSAKKFPQSFRASSVAARFLESNKQRDEAIHVLKRTVDINDSISLYAQYLKLKCEINKKLDSDDLAGLNRRIIEGKFLFWDIDSFTKYILTLVRTECVEDGFKQALIHLNTIRFGKDYNGYKIKNSITYDYALVYVHMDDYEKAHLELNELINNVTNHLQVVYIFDVLDYFIGHQKFALAKNSLDMLAIKLNTPAFERDIYNQKAQLKYYFNRLKQHISE